MDIERYLQQRQQHIEQQPQFRRICLTCLQPQICCYCAHIKRFDPKIEFVILIHPLEVRRRVATGRMSHLCLENSHLVHGHDYTKNEYVNDLLNDPDRYNVILYPGRQSQNISTLKNEERMALFPKDKKLTIFVIDGTWMTAKKMIKHSHNINKLPRICFTPPRLSNFRVRKQPNDNCFSTIEAIHHTIELLGTTNREHDKLLYVFDSMVDLQLEYIRKSHERQGPSRYKRKSA
jgi:DTW domain-containing protein YfiP